MMRWRPVRALTRLGSTLASSSDAHPYRLAMRRRAGAPAAWGSRSLHGQGDPLQDSATASTKPDGDDVGGAPRTGAWARFQHFMSKENITAPADFNRCVHVTLVACDEGFIDACARRWLAVPGSFLVQLSIGSVYAWSVFNGALTKQLGVVAQAADDWALQSVLPIFSCCALSLGLCTALLGPWAERSGPRKVASAAAACWSSGLVITGLGCLTHTLPLCYLGYGVLGGAGWGLGYISPVSTLMRWFPDKRGLATGLALTAFGGGAMAATPVNEALMHYFRRAPEFLGRVDEVELVTQHGVRFARVAGELKEVVVATATEVSSWPGLSEGVCTCRGRYV